MNAPDAATRVGGVLVAGGQAAATAADVMQLPFSPLPPREYDEALAAAWATTLLCKLGRRSPSARSDVPRSVWAAYAHCMCPLHVPAGR